MSTMKSIEDILLDAETPHKLDDSWRNRIHTMLGTVRNISKRCVFLEVELTTMLKELKE